MGGRTGTKGGSVTRTGLGESRGGQWRIPPSTAFLEHQTVYVRPGTDGGACTSNTLVDARGGRASDEGMLAQVLLAPGGCSLDFQDAPLLQEAMVSEGEETGE